MADFARETEVMAVPEPEFTDTWHPVSHARVIGALKTAVHEQGMEVVSKNYSLNKLGTRMFGSWNLNVGNGEIGYALGFRNAIDQSMRIGICSGTNVFVCSNMMFSGDFMAFRMHTSGLDTEELIRLADDALHGAVDDMRRLHEWQKSLHEHYVPQADYKGLVYDMITNGVFSGGQVQNYLTCLDEEKALRRGRTLDGCTSLYNVHGAATRLMRKWNLLRTSEATKQLNSVVDNYIEYKTAA